jgi:hypothetical protein
MMGILLGSETLPALIDESEYNGMPGRRFEAT